MTIQKPELLAPAGTRDALDAAIRAGADAVYFGGNRFNARMGADNFSEKEMEDAIRTCAFYGVKSNITLNTLPYEREQRDLLRYAEQLYRWGADAIICADLGTASLLHRYFPDLALHASTQCAGHNTDAARFFAKLGFSRMVCARELSFSDLQTLCKQSPIETELFIHGAICVSQSGGCLFSALVGGRSGNRGACAQPCRLPYTCGTAQKHARETYPLSLRDMSLAAHIPEILSLGAASLKIEGRMKSPAYVYGVISIYRRLLDEARAANTKEMETLAALFSRGGGFTDAYFLGKTGSFMQGTRTDTDKAATARAEKQILAGRHPVRKLPVSIFCTIQKDCPITFTMTCQDTSVTTEAPPPQCTEQHAPDRAAVISHMEKLGNTPFSTQKTMLILDADVTFSLSVINSLRRDASSQLQTALQQRPPYPQRITTPPLPDDPVPSCAFSKPYGTETTPYAFRRQASFLFPNRIPVSARNFYDILYIPFDVFCQDPSGAQRHGVNGIILPPVLFDSELPAASAMLEQAAKAGILHVLTANAGHLALLQPYGFQIHGSLRCNIYTGQTAAVWANAGMTDILLSPELTQPQIRDIQAPIPKGAVTYGRLPMMTLQRCIIRESANIPAGKPCSHCDTIPVTMLSDRKKIQFPVTRTYPHRNIIWNSSLLYMADKPAVLQALHVDFTHHIFTTETAEEALAIMQAYQTGLPAGTVPYKSFPAYRRIGSGSSQTPKGAAVR